MNAQPNDHIAITDILNNPKNQLASLIYKAQQLSELNQLLHNTLEKSFKKHCAVANYEDGQLTLVTNNSAWATRIRFSIPDLTEKLQEIPTFNELKNINCIIQLKETAQPIKPPAKHQQNLSPDTIRSIQTTAKNMKDKGLKAALLRLAKSMEEKTHLLLSKSIREE